MQLGRQLERRPSAHIRPGGQRRAGVVWRGPASTLGAGSLPAQAAQTFPPFPAFYDAHKHVVVVTDAFPKAAAGTLHANYAPSLSAVPPSSQPARYIVPGPAAPGQIAVLGSEPGKTITRRCGAR